MRNALPMSLVVAGMVALGLAADATAAGSCTPGQDCYCDRVRNPASSNYDPQLLGCEDFEDLAYHDNVPGGPAQEHPSIKGYRGGGSHWMTRYVNTASGSCWSQGEPASPRVGVTCAFPTCGTGEWRADDLWQSNSFAVLDVQRVGEVDDEVPGLTLDAKHDGQQWMGWRVGKGRSAGIVGVVDFPATTELGFTALAAYSSNLARASSAAFPPDPWKHEEWGGTKTTLFMGNVGAGGEPFSPTLNGKSQTACLAAVGRMILSTGRVSCDGLGNLRIGSNFNFSTDWPLGTWACVRGYMKGMGTSNGSLEIWFNDRKVFSMTNADLAGVMADQSLTNMVWNNYYNGNQGVGGGTPTTETMYRYSDNVHIRRGPPVSCEAIGFAAGGNPGAVTSPPGAPVLLP